MNPKSAREIFCGQLSQGSGSRAHFFESQLFTNLIRGFLAKLGDILTRRLAKPLYLTHSPQVANLVDEEDVLVLLFRAYQTNLEVALPLECARELINSITGNKYDGQLGQFSSEDKETLLQFVSQILIQEELFVRHRLLLRGICPWDKNDREERLHRCEELFFTLTLSSANYVLRVYCDYGFVSRLRTYGQLQAGHLVREMPFTSRWKLFASSALNSYQLLLKIVPGERISLKSLCQERYVLKQDTLAMKPCEMEITDRVLFFRRKEVL